MSIYDPPRILFQFAISAKSTYDNILTVIEKKEDPKWIYEFSSLWAQLQSQASLTRFDMEEITITGATLRRLMQQSARFGIENYQRLEEQCVKVRLHFF